MSELAGEPVGLGVVLVLWGLLVWLGGASLAAWVAWERGHPPVAWCLLALFLSPLVALIALAAVPVRRPAGPRPVARPTAPRVRSRVNGAHTEDTRWDAATSAVTTTRRPW